MVALLYCVHAERMLLSDSYDVNASTAGSVLLAGVHAPACIYRMLSTVPPPISRVKHYYIHYK